MENNKIMKKETIKNIFTFLEGNEGRKTPFVWKLINDEPLTEDDLHIKGDLDLTGSEIEELPEGLKVGGDLYLEYSSITSLPEGLEVGNHLDLRGINMESLPKGLKVGGILDLDESAMESLPEGLEVYGDLCIADTRLEEYTDKQLRKIILPGFIKGKIIR